MSASDWSKLTSLFDFCIISLLLEGSESLVGIENDRLLMIGCQTCIDSCPSIIC